MPAAKKPAQTAIHAVVGSDEAEIKRAARDLADKLTPPGDFGADIIDGTAENADAAAGRIHSAIGALNTFAFFGGAKLVWLKNANFLADNPMGRAQGVIEALEALTATLSGGLPDGTAFLLSAIDVDKRRSFFLNLKKVANLQIHDKLDTGKSGWEEAAGALVRDLAEARGLEFSAEAQEFFVLCTGGERRVAESELDKLDLYLGPANRTVRIEDVRLLVPVSKAGVVFELGNALAARQLPRALELLEQLLHEGESAIGILLVAIIPTVRNLLVARDLMTRHKLPRPQQSFFFGKTLERLSAEALAHLPRKKDGTMNTFALGIAAQHAHRFELPELRTALASCLEANVQLVTSALEPQVVLSQLLVRICSCTQS
jgi:DNA polymerase-3 subunit delta